MTILTLAVPLACKIVNRIMGEEFLGDTEVTLFTTMFTAIGGWATPPHDSEGVG